MSELAKAAGLEYETVGSGEPVLLIHGSHVTDSFVPLVADAALAERYRLIRYRRRGFAGSDPAPRPFSIADQASDAMALLGNLGIATAHVVGHSYGAVTALELALQAPDTVQSLVLLEPPILSPESAAELPALLDPALQAYGSGDAAGAVTAFMTIVCGPDWRREVGAVVPEGPAQAEADAATFFEVEVPALGEWVFDADRAAGITQPTLFVLGADSGPLFEGSQQLFSSFVPQTTLVVLPGLNHLLQMRNANLVASAIAEFLAKHPIDG